ncbi:DUF3822 family protein [Changchengzhania lutea]|uniref:DUF3822 family protein n=1 Tax=Changchengzhania lutea TaxID=2049305 RepID=UPI00115EDE7D|nr:DUF3822 family protein [Changchengzhania lutea]
MIPKNNISNNIKNKVLSIQISLSGLSFCILQKDTQTISVLREILFDKGSNPLEVLDYLKQLFETDADLDSDFSDIHIIHDNALSALVPKPLFNEDCLADYLKFNSKILKSDFITYDEISAHDSVNVYIPYVNINNFIFDKFGAFTYKHISTVLMEQIIRLEQNQDDSEKMYAHVDKTHFEIVVIKQSKIQLYNAFQYHSKEDFIYYMLFTAEQLELDPESLELILIGKVEKHDALYNIAYKYIRHIRFGKRSDTYNYQEAPNSNHSNFTLLQNF